MKKILQISLLIISGLYISTGHTQTIQPDFSKKSEQDEKLKAQTLEAIKSVVVLNGKILGLANFCKLDKGKSKSVVSYFNNVMGSVGLTTEDAKLMEKEFSIALKNATDGKDLPSGFNCKDYSKTFDEIYNKTQLK